MKISRNNICGRSMVEMLGVLAIVGVLSAGALAGFNKAMSMHKMNKNIANHERFIVGMLKYKKEFESMHAHGEATPLNDFAIKLGLVPPEWSTDANYIYDSFKNRFDVIIGSSTDILVVRYTISVDGKSSKKALCQQMISKFLMPNSYFFDHFRLNGGNNVDWYGDLTCGTGRKCLSNMTLSDVNELCETCQENKSCRLYWYPL